LFAFLVLSHGRRQLLWFEVTRHPTAEWLARQITEAFPWTSAPIYLVRDNDAAYGHVFTSRLRAMGIRDRPISPRSPWQNGYAERLIGTLRRECLDRMLIFGEAHLRRILSMYAIYYNESRTHLSLHKDAPLHRAIQRSGTFVACRSWVDCIIAMRGYDFRKGHAIYGAAVARRLCAMGIRDKPIAPGSPWQNGYAERLIGTIRRECVDHLIVFERLICAGSFASMPPTTMACGPIAL
ncbi:MAG: integrase core domain-containing protein, partial [Xanthobacteraceae bacterium]